LKRSDEAIERDGLRKFPATEHDDREAAQQQDDRQQDPRRAHEERQGQSLQAAGSQHAERTAADDEQSRRDQHRPRMAREGVQRAMPPPVSMQVGRAEDCPGDDQRYEPGDDPMPMKPSTTAADSTKPFTCISLTTRRSSAP